MLGKEPKLLQPGQVLPGLTERRSWAVTSQEAIGLVLQGQQTFEEASARLKGLFRAVLDLGKNKNRGKHVAWYGEATYDPKLELRIRSERGEEISDLRKLDLQFGKRQFYGVLEISEKIPPNEGSHVKLIRIHPPKTRFIFEI